MRTHIAVDDLLMKGILRLTSIKTKREVVETSLRQWLRLRQQK